MPTCFCGTIDVNLESGIIIDTIQKARDSSRARVTET